MNDKIKETINLEDFNSQWHECFKNIKLLLEDISLFLSIEHIGSTAITHIKAKNIIDIQCGVKELPLNKGVILQLASIGFKHFEHIKQDHVPFKEMDYFETGWDKQFFVNDDDEKIQYNLHVRVQDSPNWKFSLGFRDYLNTNENVRIAYEQVKERLCAADVNLFDYCAIKDPVCDLIYLLMQRETHE